MVISSNSEFLVRSCCCRCGRFSCLTFRDQVFRHHL
ncbi:hypothetical protein SOVF_104920 [Spinacia oleracea]|nr:hypothetical protein SOVF_104920 [Spinacia oleracea]